MWWYIIDYMSSKYVSKKQYEETMKRLRTTKRSEIRPSKVFKNKKKYSRKAKHK